MPSSIESGHCLPYLPPRSDCTKLCSSQGKTSIDMLEHIRASREKQSFKLNLVLKPAYIAGGFCLAFHSGMHSHSCIR